jgi:fumarylpyruvate hydrolase
MKPGDAVLPVAEGTVGQMHYPTLTQSLHHELELVVAIGTGGRDIPAAKALDHVWGYAVGLDMTRRDLQLEARDKGRPWEFGKSFALSAPIGALHRAADMGHPGEAAIKLLVNGQPRQSSDIAKLIWSVAECMAYLSAYETLEPGDLIMTGTPEGVGAVVAGDVMRGSISGLGEIEVRVVG